GPRGMAHRREDHGTRVEQRAVEVEEHNREAHGSIVATIDLVENASHFDHRRDPIRSRLPATEAAEASKARPRGGFARSAFVRLAGLGLVESEWTRIKYSPHGGAVVPASSREPPSRRRSSSSGVCSSIVPTSVRTMWRRKLSASIQRSR